MNNNKILKIEVHKDNALQASSFVANQKKYLQDISSFHNKLKEKLKDRHRIRGVFFSEPKGNVKNKLKRKNYKLGKDEKNYKLSMKKYTDLKHEIFLRQRKEKEEIEIKKIFDEKQVKKDLNYTNIKEFMYTFLRFKKKSNLYRENIKKNELSIRSTNKMKKNFVNQSLKNVVLHFQKVRGKVDTGQLPFEENYDEAYGKLVDLIAKSRTKIMNKLRSEIDPFSPKRSPFSKRQSAKNLNSSEKKKNNDKNSMLNLLFKDEQSNKDDNSSYVESAESNNKNENNGKNNLILIENKENESNENENENKENGMNEIKENKLEYEEENEKSEKDIIHYENKKEIKPTKKLSYFGKEAIEENFNNKYKFRKSNNDKKYKYFLSDKGLKIDINNNNFFKTDSRAQRFNNMKFESNTNSTSHLAPNQETSKLGNTIYNYMSNKNIMNNIFTFNNNDFEKKIIETEKNVTPINNSNANINSANQNSKINKSSESFINNTRNVTCLNNIKKMKKNKGLLMSQRQKKNPKYWNNNFKRAQTAGHRCSTAYKVKNKPFYANKIEDLIKEYNRIKSSTRKSKKKMKENLYITLGNIDKIASIKEDMLMFNLKMKYFKCGYPKTKVKTVSKRKMFTTKIKNDVEMLDNPFYYDFPGFDDDSSYDNNNNNNNYNF